MRQNLTLLVFLYSLYGFAQFYVQEGTTLSFGGSEVLVSSQETHNQINTSIVGEGALLLNSVSVQQLTSTKAVLKLPTLHIKNADLVQIKTALILKDRLLIDRGFLQLSHTLTLTDSRALVLGKTAKILTTPCAPLKYQRLLTNGFPSEGIYAQTQLIYIKPIPTESLFLIIDNNTQRSHFGMLPQKAYEAYFELNPRPPKAV